MIWVQSGRDTGLKDVVITEACKAIEFQSNLDFAEGRFSLFFFFFFFFFFFS